MLVPIFQKKYIFGVILGIIILIFDFLTFRGTEWFVPGIAIAITITWAQYWMDFFIENQKQKMFEAKFLEFVRNLASAIKSGIPAGRAIMHVSHADYGALSPYTKKLANQVEWAIPLHKALFNFSSETANPVIKRSISTVIEAERAGGNLEDVLESITNSLVEIKKIKMTRKANIQGTLIQSYIIFFVFLGVMIVIQNMLIPYLGSFGAGNDVIGMGGQGSFMDEEPNFDFSSIESALLSIGDWVTSLRGILLMLALIQGCFAGLVMGKLAEGDIGSGVKHSLILMTVAFFVITLAQGFLK